MQRAKEYVARARRLRIVFELRHRGIRHADAPGFDLERFGHNHIIGLALDLHPLEGVQMLDEPFQFFLITADLFTWHLSLVGS